MCTFVVRMQPLPLQQWLYPHARGRIPGQELEADKHVRDVLENAILSRQASLLETALKAMRERGLDTDDAQYDRACRTLQELRGCRQTLSSS